MKKNINKNLPKFSQTKLFEDIESFTNFLSDDYNKQKVTLKFYKSRKHRTDSRTKYNKKINDYELVYKMFCDKYGQAPISKSSLWRILKIKENSKSIYDEIKGGNLAVREGYDMLFNPKITKNNIVDKQNTQEGHFSLDSELNFDNLYSDLKNINSLLNGFKMRDSKSPSDKLLHQIDEEVFKLRKGIGKIIADSYNDEQ